MKNHTKTKFKKLIETMVRRELRKLRLSENTDSGLYVIPSTPADLRKLEKWLSGSVYQAEINARENYAYFPEKTGLIDALEKDLTEEFDTFGISARFERA